MPVTCAEAAAELGVSASQVRRWIQSGAPVARDRRPMLVDLEDLRQWRQRQAADVLHALAVSMLRAVRCEMADGKSASRLLGIDDRRAAALMLATFDRVHVDLTGHESDGAVHEAVAQMRRIAGLAA